MKGLNKVGILGKAVICSIVIAVIIFSVLESCPCFASPLIFAESTSIDFGMATKHDLDVGFIEPAPSPLDYMLRLNVIEPSAENWVVGVMSDSPYFYSSGMSKTCEDLKWRINGNGAWSEMSQFSSEVAHGTGSESVDLDFKIMTGWQDAPDVHYGLTLIFTVSQEF